MARHSCWHDQLQASCSESSQHCGFTLVELLVSSVLIATVLGSLAVLPQIIGRGSLQTEQRIIRQSAIDGDLAQLRQLAKNFTCCSGDCAISSTCNGASPGSPGFYEPSDPTNKAAFSTTCSSPGGLAAPLRTLLQLQATPPGITRSIPEPSPADAAAHRVRIQYTSPGNVERLAILVPTAASFCPDPA